MSKVVIVEPMSASSLFMKVRGANFPPIISSDDFQRTGIFQLFEVKLESCVFLPADSFQMKVEGNQQQQVAVASGVCSWKTSCSGIVHS